MSDESLFSRTAELSSNLKRLKTEERMLSARLRDREGYEATADHGSLNDASAIDDSQRPVDEYERLNELKAEVWEAAAELESLFLEFAKSEFAQLESIVEATPGHDLGAVCSAAAQAVVVRYVQDFGSLLSKNNNVAHLLVQFSSHLDPNDHSRRGNAVTNGSDVRVLRDEDGSRYRGVRVNDQEVRFIDIEMSFDEFQSTVLKAVEDWKMARLVRVERRAELRKELREVNLRN